MHQPQPAVAGGARRGEANVTLLVFKILGITRIKTVQAQRLAAETEKHAPWDVPSIFLDNSVTKIFIFS